VYRLDAYKNGDDSGHSSAVMAVDRETSYILFGNNGSGTVAVIMMNEETNSSDGDRIHQNSGMKTPGVSLSNMLATPCTSAVYKLD
jgi:hypothetical protein